ncbi:MAG TPA: hypothetical protein VEW48_01175 [Thermoanaerobaculia bacterium]|nr:hypothetical protein [Thermoanaerobaculia bacterium]
MAPPIVVSFRSLNQSVTGSESAQAAESAVKEVAESPAQQALLLAQFGAGLRALEDAAEDVDPEVLIAPQNRMASLLQSYLAEEGEKKGTFEQVPQGGAELKFFTDDFAGWAKSFFSWVQKNRWHPIARPATDDPEPLAGKVRLGLLADWGTGLYGAPDCTKSIDNDPEDFQLLFHLGDIYYAGTEKEVRDRFLALWSKRPGAVSRSLNGNHDMYSGGFGYFDDLFQAFGQTSSYFALQNEHWTLAALDTAHTDNDLDDEQVRWLKKIVAGAGDRKVVLFSHHQLFSRLESQGKNLAAKLGELLTGKRIFAWYWGHEHRCTIHQQHPVYAMYARCLGHGGMPYDRKKAMKMPEDHRVGDAIWRRFDAQGMVPAGLMLDGANEYMREKADKYGPNGYMALEIEGPHLTEVAYDTHGREIYRKGLA